MEFEFILSLRANQMDISYLMILGFFVVDVVVFAIFFLDGELVWKN